MSIIMPIIIMQRRRIKSKGKINQECSLLRSRALFSSAPCPWCLWSWLPTLFTPAAQSCTWCRHHWLPCAQSYGLCSSHSTVLLRWTVLLCIQCFYVILLNARVSFHKNLSSGSLPCTFESTFDTNLHDPLLQPSVTLSSLVHQCQRQAKGYC